MYSILFLLFKFIYNIKPRKNSIFSEKGETVFLVGNLELLYILDDETDFIVEFVSRNLVT